MTSFFIVSGLLRTRPDPKSALRAKDRHVARSIEPRRRAEGVDATMMQYPLTINHPLDRAVNFFQSPQSFPGCRTNRHIGYTMRFMTPRRLPVRCKSGLKRGERVATLMWNHTHPAYFRSPVAGGAPLRSFVSPTSVHIDHAQDRFHC